MQENIEDDLQIGAGVTAQVLKTRTVFAEDPSLVLSSHFSWTDNHL